MNIAEFGVRKHVAVNLIMFAMIGAGVILGSTLRREFFPEVSPTLISVSAPYPGAQPDEIEDSLAIKIEDRVADLQGVKEINTTAIEGAATVGGVDAPPTTGGAGTQNIVLPRIDRTVLGGGSTLRLETGDIETMTLGFRAEYTAPNDDETALLLPGLYLLGVDVGYERFLFRRTFAVTNVRFRHIEIYDFNASNRVAQGQFGLRWSPSRTLEIVGTGGAQLVVGEPLAVEEDLETSDSNINIYPAAFVGLNWDFIRNNGVAGRLRANTGLDGIVDQATGDYVPTVYSAVGVELRMPWGQASADAEALTSLADVEPSVLPTVLGFRAELVVPASAYLGFFFRARVYDRAPPLDTPNFEFVSLEATGEVGLRLWWSSGRDERLPRPSEALDEESEES